MHFLAAAVASKSSADRLREIPPEFWVKIGLGILVLVAVVIALRKLAKMNKIILSIVVLLVVSIIGFNWIYERNEPAWATPAVKWLANDFPTKGAIDAGPGSGTR
jgi:cell division protein FtsW (lipid II flippase)